jgi:5-deoxy-glucuronate isomerase
LNQPTTARTPNGLDLTYHQVPPDEPLVLGARPQQETALILISGQLTATLPDGDHVIERTGPCTAPAAGWHLPPGTQTTATAGPRGAEVVEVHTPITGTPPEEGTVTAVTAPEREVRGSGSWERHVTTLLRPPRTAGLLLGETLALDGRWSTYPPHRHQHSNPPDETALQEAFAFRVRPSSGFGVLLTYDETIHDARSTVITDTSLATVPSGYHTIAAAAGHDLYYLWAAHGETDTPPGHAHRPGPRLAPEPLTHESPTRLHEGNAHDQPAPPAASPSSPAAASASAAPPPTPWRRPGTRSSPPPAACPPPRPLPPASPRTSSTSPTPARWQPWNAPSPSTRSR